MKNEIEVKEKIVSHSLRFLARWWLKINPNSKQGVSALRYTGRVEKTWEVGVRFSNI